MIKLTMETTELIGEVAQIVAGLKHAGVRGFVPEPEDESRLHCALRAPGEIERRVNCQTEVRVETLLLARELIGQLHRAVADGVLDPRSVPISLVDAQALLEETIRDAGHGDALSVSPGSCPENRPGSAVTSARGSL